MKQSLVTAIVLTGLFAVFLSGSCWGGNLVVNGGFETIGTDPKQPAGWQVNTARETNAEIALDNTMAHSGTYSFKIDIAQPGGRVMIFPDAGTIKKALPGKSYNLSLWMKAKNLDYNQFFVTPAVRLNFQPTRVRPVPTIDLMAYMKGANDWRQLNLIVTAPDDVESINLDIMMTKGTVWIDDISLTAVEDQ